MIRHGKEPYLECSSKGDKRFSAFYARLKKYDNKSIEEIYQASKIFENGETGLSWKEAKGRKAINQEECHKLNGKLWDEYISENKELLGVLKSASGLSDMFGQEGHACQATELWRIRNNSNKPILLIDAYNMYVRMFYPNSTGGYVDPSIYGCIRMMRLIYENIYKYDKVYIVLDSDRINHDKNKMFEEYKDGRESKKELFKNFNEFLGILSKLPKLEIVRNIYREADEVIAHIALNKCENNKVIIYSNDKDFCQLTSIDSNILLATNFKDGNFITLSNEDILDKFTVTKKSKDGEKIKIRYTENIQEIIKWRTFVGDSSDNISPAIKGLRKDKIKIIIDNWKEDYLNDDILANIIMRLDDMDLKMKIAENFKTILLNYELMNLSKCGKDFKLRKYTKKININVSRENYLNLLSVYNLDKFKEFMLLRGYLN